MELKEYQNKAIGQVRAYLEALCDWDAKCREAAKILGVGDALDPAAKAWGKVRGGLAETAYRSRRNGLGRYVPNFCLKVPTGGGKTLLAVKTLDLIQSVYLKRRNGLVLWVVPSEAIYRQTFRGLKDRNHPYRQHLDLASGGRTLVREKTDHFTPEDVTESLVVMLLMLPSAWRKNRETLRLFRDSGGFAEFFPGEDDTNGHASRLAVCPNLEWFQGESALFPKQIKTSLGNTLRWLEPLVILDEGQKAYGENSQKALYDLNPRMIVELSATPLSASNILVDISGQEVNREGMIKLDMHVINKASVSWTDTLTAAVSKRNLLHSKAREYEANSGVHIRPICLIQVERTGKDQRGKNFIHADDVREHLIRTAGIPEECIAIKTSEQDDIEGLDLLSRDCPVEYIITKQALQEGWDCSLAYVLAILTNPHSKNNLTQLVGRILRQPYATKTKIPDLDESYVFCFQQNAHTLLESIRAGFSGEGLGDLTTKIVRDEMAGQAAVDTPKTASIRDKFRGLGAIYLPVFAIQDSGKMRLASYESDIASRIDWEGIDTEAVKNTVLSASEEKDTATTITMAADPHQVVRPVNVMRLRESGIEIDYEFMTRQLLDIIPGPWVAFQYGKTVLDHLMRHNPMQLVAGNFVYIIEELRKHALNEKERLAEQVFRRLVKDDVLQFLLLKDSPESELPEVQPLDPGSIILNRSDGQPLQRSLFDPVPQHEFNGTEMNVAWYLDDQGKLLWWYRNLSRQNYFIQGWRRDKIYPDFIFTDAEGDTAYSKVFVVETKGVHLKNDDTAYKQSVFELCNRIGVKQSWSSLSQQFPEKKVIFKVIFDTEWQSRVNELLAAAVP